jgi:hypothetical protein
VAKQYRSTPGYDLSIVLDQWFPRPKAATP